MKFVLLAALVVVAAVSSLEVTNLDLVEWENFKVSYTKKYGSETEELKRKSIFLNNLKMIREHNAKFENGRESYTLGVNKYADMSHEEFVNTMNRYRSSYVRRGDKYVSDVKLEDLPQEVDWRKQGAVTDIKDQQSCGSCWAFSTTGSVEGQHFLKHNELVSLSEQQLVDCSSAYGNEGCNGGLMDNAFTYIQKNKGIDTEASYPYKGVDGDCNYKPKKVAAKVSGFSDIDSGNEDDLLTAVANVGPISVAMDASPLTFQFYSSGIFKSLFCKNGEDDLDHGVLAVGYGTLNNTWFSWGGDYWLIKNSWGTSWGIGGYFMLARNSSNMCGVATEASYPKVP